MASNDSASKMPFNLLDLPDEILLNIFDWVLYKEEYIYRTVIRLSYYLAYRYHHICVDGDRCMPMYDRLKPSNLGLDPNTLSLFRVNKRISKLGSSILYGSYKFYFHEAEPFRVLFPRQISQKNISLMRSVELGELPHAVKTMPSRHLPRCLELFGKMPHLQHLVIYTSTWGRPRTLDPADFIAEPERGLLLMAAWVTLRHGNLKLAVFEESGTVDFDGVHHPTARGGVKRVILTSRRPGNLQHNSDPECVSQYNLQLSEDRLFLNRKWYDWHKSQVAYYAYARQHKEFLIFMSLWEITPFGLLEDDFVSREYPFLNSESQTPIHIEPRADPRLPPLTVEEDERRAEKPRSLQPISGLLIDSYKVRYTGFEALARPSMHSPLLYQLHPNAHDSESNTPRSFPAMSTSVLRNELFSYNNRREDTLKSIRFPGADLRELCRQAEQLERRDINREMDAKDGTWFEGLNEGSDTESSDEVSSSSFVGGEAATPDNDDAVSAVNNATQHEVSGGHMSQMSNGELALYKEPNKSPLP